ncbi:MAG: hypothetical protein Q8P59_14900, partial [Dehalococcoidia bacterium]|nr:hypothetical protein [Dehalococcoidia bacterium]
MRWGREALILTFSQREKELQERFWNSAEGWTDAKGNIRDLSWMREGILRRQGVLRDRRGV